MRVCFCLSLVLATGGLLRGEESKALPPGYIQGDGVVTYSYVPNKCWSRQESLGILPYLFEYELFAWDDDKPLEVFHEENVRRIDLASQWSTAIMFYARRLRFRDEIIRLMIRAFRHRQLIVLRDYWKPGDEHHPFDKTRDILETLWARRDEYFENPEGDKATGRQLINNILMVKTGDENFCGLKTAGLGTIYRTFEERVQSWEIAPGERPFGHIKAWYNLVGWAAWDYGSCWASGPDDLAKGRYKLPANTECIGVDVYDYWWHGIPFDPVRPENRSKVLARVHEWHHIRTEYFPDGVRTCVCENSRNPETWTPECWNDTHALMAALDFAGATKAMMIYIGLSSSLEKVNYTTPIETMDAYYDNLKAGPWVGLCWWTSVGRLHPKEDPLGTLGYVDKTLVHYTPEHPEGVPYSPEELERIRERFLASRMRMFKDVVIRQFGHLNGMAEVRTLPKGRPTDLVSGSFLAPAGGDFLKPEDVGLEAETVHFPNRFGHRLRGWFFDRPGTDRTILFCMGNTGNASYMLQYAEILSDGGFDVLLFDYQGFGESEGVASLLSLAADAESAFAYLVEERKLSPEQIGVLGVSLGSVLAVRLAAVGKARALAVESLFLPSEQIREAKRYLEENKMLNLLLSGLEATVLPAVDPLVNLLQVEGPVFLMHGQRDGLLPLAGTVRAAQATRTPTRIWFMEGVGHAPESLEINDREFADQILRFFREAFETGKVEIPLISFEARPKGEGFSVTVTVEDRERRPVQLALADAAGHLSLSRLWTAKGTRECVVETAFRPEHVSAIAFLHVRNDGEGGWEPDLSKLSTDLHGVREFAAELRRRAGRPTRIVRSGNAVRLRHAHDSEAWAWAREHLPEAASVHPRIRPRYARLLAWIAASLEDPIEAETASLTMIPYLPEDPMRYYELGNATLALGLKNRHIADACLVAAKVRQREGDLEECKRILHLWRDILPEGESASVTAGAIDSMDGGTDLESLRGKEEG